jgi:hypothetical protein
VFGGTPNRATESVALPRIGVHLRPFAVAFGLSRNCFTINYLNFFFYSHDENLTRSAKNRKTYRRLFGMIFFGGSEPMLAAALQRLATHEILKNRQNTKANSFFISGNIDLPAKTP